MNEHLSSCLCSLDRICSVSALCPVLQLLAPAPSSHLATIDSAAALLSVMVVVAHPHVQIANLCFASALCCVLSCFRMTRLSSLPMAVISTLACFCLDQPCTSKPIPSPSPLKIMTGLLRWRHPAVLRSYFLFAPLVATCLALVLYQLVTALPCAVCDWLCGGERCSSPKFGLIANRYHFCEKCFNEIQGETVSLGDDPTQPQTWVLFCLLSKIAPVKDSCIYLKLIILT